MKNLALKLREQIPTDIFTDSDVFNLIGGSANSRYSAIKRAISQGDLISLRRGVYCLGRPFQRMPLDKMEMAQKIYAPSYISLETALSYHSLIPEAVYTTTSICLKRSVSFNTPVGLFSYSKMAKFNFIGVDRVHTNHKTLLIANPTKALADYITTYKSELNPKDLLQSLRIDENAWKQISLEQLQEIFEFTKQVRLKRFLQKAKKGY